MSVIKPAHRHSNKTQHKQKSNKNKAGKKQYERSTGAKALNPEKLK